MQTAYPWILPHKTLLSDVLDLCHPDIVMKFEQINAFKNSLFIFRLKEAIATQKRGDDASTLKNEITLKGVFFKEKVEVAASFHRMKSLRKMK